MKIEKVSISSLESDPHNVREHGERGIEAIKASLLRFGQQKPIVVDGNGVVIAGNGTLGAATLLGWSKIQIVKTELIGAEAVAFAIADNQTATLSDWDFESLTEVLNQLDDELLPAIGFQQHELDLFMDAFQPMDSDEALDDLMPNLDQKEIVIKIPSEKKDLLDRATSKATKHLCQKMNNQKTILHLLEEYVK
jgi:hypothetical protein